MGDSCKVAVSVLFLVSFVITRYHIVGSRYLTYNRQLSEFPTFYDLDRPIKQVKIKDNDESCQCELYY